MSPLTRKKEIIGDFKACGSLFRPFGTPLEVLDHDFSTVRATPYGLYDLQRNTGFVNLSLSADTSEFAVESIRRWWNQRGKSDYPGAGRLLLTADCGGSNGYNRRMFKKYLADFALETGLEIHVCHYPPGCSKYNKIERRLFSQISVSMQGHPLTSISTLQKLIESAATVTGLKVQCVLDENSYVKGQKISDRRFASLPVTHDNELGDWNYMVSPSCL